MRTRIEVWFAALGTGTAEVELRLIELGVRAARCDDHPFSLAGRLRSKR